MDLRDYTMQRLGRVEKAPTRPTLNDPVLLFNRFRIYEVGLSLVFIVIFGVLRSDWLLTLALVALMLLASPALRRRVPPAFVLRKILDRCSKLPLGRFTWGRSKTSL